MKLFTTTVILITLFLAGCSGENDLVGTWKATTVDMKFAKGRIPPGKMKGLEEKMLRENSPRFELNADKSARVHGGGINCKGSWSVKDNIISVQCPNKFIKLEKNRNQLTTLPDRTFTFERQ